MTPKQVLDLSTVLTRAVRVETEQRSDKDPTNRPASDKMADFWDGLYELAFDAPDAAVATFKALVTSADVDHHYDAAMAIDGLVATRPDVGVPLTGSLLDSSVHDVRVAAVATIGGAIEVGQFNHLTVGQVLPLLGVFIEY